jgi:hypothetical protein
MPGRRIIATAILEAGEPFRLRRFCHGCRSLTASPCLEKRMIYDAICENGFKNSRG